MVLFYVMRLSSKNVVVTSHFRTLYREADFLFTRTVDGCLSEFICLGVFNLNSIFYMRNFAVFSVVLRTPFDLEVRSLV